MRKKGTPSFGNHNQEKVSNKMYTLIDATVLLYFSRCHLEIYLNLLRNRFGLSPVIAINFDFNPILVRIM
jgi:hypothetical protein